MRNSLSNEVGGGGDHSNLEREVTKINREYEEVIKDMDRMRIDFREKSNLVGDCENLQMMIGYVKGDIEGKKGRMKVVEENEAKTKRIRVTSDLTPQDVVKLILLSLEMNGA